MTVNDSKQNQLDSTEKEEPPQCPICSAAGKWRWFIVAVVVALIIVIFADRSYKQNTNDTPSIVWSQDYKEALKQTKEQNKPLLIAFHASWCLPCQRMKKTTYHDPEVIKISESFIRLVIDSDAQPGLANLYNVQVIPTYVILRPDGTKIKSFAGYYPPADFIAKLKTAL